MLVEGFVQVNEPFILYSSCEQLGPPTEHVCHEKSSTTIWIKEQGTPSHLDSCERKKVAN